MFARDHRITTGEDFNSVMRSGVRSGRRNVVLYGLGSAATPREGHVNRAGFIVSKKVGNAVKRNLVKRRLRAVVAQADVLVPLDLVVRALPGAAQASFGQLEQETLSALASITKKIELQDKGH